MKTKLLVTHKVIDRVVEAKIFEIDLADMVTLIDWYNPDAEEVFESIKRMSDEIQNSYGNMEGLPQLDAITKETFSKMVEDVAYRGAIKKGITEAYFVDLYDWKERPPKKLRKPQGERVFFIQVDIGFLNEFIIRRSGLTYLYQEDSDKSVENVKKSNGILEIGWITPPEVTYSQSAIKELKDSLERDERTSVVCIYRKKDESVLRKVLTPKIAKLFF